MHPIKSSSAFWYLYIMHCLECVIPVVSISTMDTCSILLKLIDLNNKGDAAKIVSSLEDATTEREAAMPPKLRVKRQSSGGKYTDAAKMPQVKVLRLILQMIRNSWSNVYIGGAHPFHHEVPKPIVILFKDKVIEFFFPDVGAETKTE